MGIYSKPNMINNSETIVDSWGNARKSTPRETQSRMNGIFKSAMTKDTGRADARLKKF